MTEWKGHLSIGHLNFSLWQLNTMTGDAYEKTYKLLKKEGFERLDITRHDRSVFLQSEGV